MCCTWKEQGSFLSPTHLPRSLHSAFTEHREAHGSVGAFMTLSARSHASVPDPCLLGNMASQEMRQATLLCWCSAQPPFPNAGCVPLDICLCYQGNHVLVSAVKKKLCLWMSGFSTVLLTHCWSRYCLYTVHNQIPLPLCLFYLSCPRFHFFNDPQAILLIAESFYFWNNCTEKRWDLFLILTMYTRLFFSFETYTQLDNADGFYSFPHIRASK